MTIQTVKLSQLRLSPLNVRKVKPKAIESLAADILAHGVLQNLVGYADGSKFEVCAGGRRYRALKLLEKNKSISSSYQVNIDVRSKSEAVELSLAENSAREAIHSADAVGAYGALVASGLSPEDIAARFGVAISYVTKVLRLAALHEDILAAFAKDQIGMEAAQALTLTQDHEMQRKAYGRCGNQPFAIRRMLTNDKMETSSPLFRFVGSDAYTQAGGTMTCDLFAQGNEGYADQPELVEQLAMEKLSAIEAGFRAQGWSDVRAMLERPYDYYNFTMLHADGVRAATEQEQAVHDTLDAAIAMRQSEVGDGYYHDRDFSQLQRQRRTIEAGLASYGDAIKSDGAILLFVNNEGEAEAKAIRVKKAKAGTDKPIAKAKPDYSAPMVETLSRIKTLAVQEAVATNPALALDILLDTLVGQIVHGDAGSDYALSLRIDGFNIAIADEMMSRSAIHPRCETGLADIALVPAADRFTHIRKLDEQSKANLLALLVAAQLNGTIASAGWASKRHEHFDMIAQASGVDIAAKWEAPVAFYDRLTKSVILKIMAQSLGQEAAENCAKLKKHELAAIAADRMSGRGWLPAPLQIEAADSSAEDAIVPTGNDTDNGTGNDDAAYLDEAA